MADQNKSVKLGEIIREFDLEVLRKAPHHEDVPLRRVSISSERRSLKLESNGITPFACMLSQKKGCVKKHLNFCLTNRA